MTADRRLTTKLTNTVVEGAPAKAKRYVLWDSDVRGFGLRVEPTGRKSFIVRYRSGGGGRSAPRLQMRIEGQPGKVLSADNARKLARRILNEVAHGKNPAGERADKRKERTLGDVLDEYLAKHVARKYKPSTAAEARRQVEKVIKPALGRVKIGDLTRSKIKQWHQDLGDKPYEGNRALAYLRSALSIAQREWEYLSENPAAGITKHDEKARERFFTDAELSRIGEALREIEAKAVPGCATAVRLLSLTGMRLSEVLGLRWDEIDFDGGCARLPDAKAGARTVPLGAPVLTLLAGLNQAGAYVCEAADSTKPVHLKTFRRFWKQIHTKAGLMNARPHDFRHTAGTYVSQGGANAFVVRDILGHKTMAMTGRYVAKSVDPLRAATDQFSGRVAAAMDAGLGAEIVPLKKA